MNKLIIVIGVLSLLTVSCASYDNRSFSGLKSEPAKVRFGTSVFFAPHCPTQGGIPEEGSPDRPSAAPALLSTLSVAATSLGSEFLTNLVVDSVKASKDGLNGQFIASGVVSGDSLKNGFCLIISRGLYGERENIVHTDKYITDELLASLGMADYPAFYLETLITEKGSSLISDPAYLSYATQSAKSKGSGYKNVSAVIAISDAALASSKEKIENHESVFRHDFGKLKIGEAYFDKTLARTSSSQKKPAVIKDLVNINVVVTESEEPSIAMNALVETFSNKKSDIKSIFEEVVKDVVGSK